LPFDGSNDREFEPRRTVHRADAVVEGVRVVPDHPSLREAQAR
jgi:hypothetical protein